MSESVLLYWYWLRDIKGVGPARARALVEHFGSPHRAYEAGIDDYLRVVGIGKDLARAINDGKVDLPKSGELLDRELLMAAKLHARMLTWFDPEYPALLKQEVEIAPPILYCRGKAEMLSRQTVAIVGTRHPSPEGARWARRCAQGLAGAGWQVISGLATGIDAAGHQGALDSAGFTAAVLGCGVDRVYPPENRLLFDAILDSGGAVLSEYPFGAPPRGDNLRKRNKLIVALSRGVIIAECPADSGTLIAVQEAFDQARPLFAFSFPDGRSSATGSGQLLAQRRAMRLDPEASSDSLVEAIRRFEETTVAVLLDLDGVLGDTSRLSRNALSLAVGFVDGFKPDKEKVDRVLHMSPRSALANLSDASIETLLREYRRFWEARYDKDLIANPTLKPILEKLKQFGVHLGVVTSRNRTQASAALEALKLTALFQVVTTWGDTTQHKPQPAPLLHALQGLPSCAVRLYVGDQSEDFAAARAAGMVAVKATWFNSSNAGDPESDLEPEHVVDQPSKLFELVQRLRLQHWAVG